jgi:SRSO17 transposase
LIRRSIADGELAFFSTWCPAGTGIKTLVRVEGHRWAIEDGFETAKTELGLDHNETRSPRWSPDHRTFGDGSAGLLAADGTAGTNPRGPRAACRSGWATSRW